MDKYESGLLSNNQALLHNEMRCREYASHRLEAVTLLEEERVRDNVTLLLNMALYDPDAGVAAKAKERLNAVFGAEIKTMLEIEGAGGLPYEDPWLVPCRLVSDAMRASRMDDTYEEINELVAAGDIEGLHQALRYPDDADFRLAVVKTLSRHSNAQTPEMLANAALYDPDETVQQQAFSTLYTMIGNEKATKLIDSVAQFNMESLQEWMLPSKHSEYSLDEEESEPEDASPFGISRNDQLNGLVNLTVYSRDPQKRIRVMKELLKSSDVRVNEVVARLALFDEAKSVREFARAAIEERCGDQAAEFLEHIKGLSLDNGLTLPDEDEDIEEYVEAPKPNSFSSQLGSQPPVVSDDDQQRRILIMLGCIALIAVLVLFMLFK